MLRGDVREWADDGFVRWATEGGVVDRAASEVPGVELLARDGSVEPTKLELPSTKLLRPRDRRAARRPSDA